MKGLQGNVGTNASSPTSKLRSLSVSLYVIAYRWNFRDMNVSRSFLKPKSRERNLRGAAFISGTRPDDYVGISKAALWPFDGVWGMVFDPKRVLCR